MNAAKNSLGAMPADVRKGSAFLSDFIKIVRGCASNAKVRRSLVQLGLPNAKAEPFRTSGGEAGCYRPYSRAKNHNSSVILF